MKKPIVSLSFTKLTDANLVTKTSHVIASMTGNSSYPTPTPALATVQTALEAFSEALTEAADGGKKKTALKNGARVELLDLLRNLALYVQQNINDDLAVLLSSGFDAQKEPQPAGVLPAPQGATLLNGTLSGVLDLRSRPVVNAKSYETQISTDVNKEESWEDAGQIY